MKYIPLVWAGLWRKPLRTALTMFSLITAFLLFGVLQGITAGFEVLQGATKEDRIFAGPRFGVPLPRSYAEQITRVNGVRVIAPRMGLFGYYQDPKNTMAIVTTDERFLQARDELVVSPQLLAEWKANRAGLLVGRAVAKKFELKAGDRLPFRSSVARTDGGKDWIFEITGVIEDRNDPDNTRYILAHYDYVNEDRAGDRDKVDRFFIRVDEPRRAAEIGREIDALFANSSFPTITLSDRDAAQSGRTSISDIHLIVTAVVGAVMFMLLFITGTIMMQSFRERTPELAVLKTMGFVDSALLTLVIAESVVQCLLGAAIGLAGAWAFSPVIRDAVNLPAGVSWPTMAMGLLIALAVAGVSGGLPAWKAKQLSVIDGLAVR